MGVGQRERRQDGEWRLAETAKPAANHNAVVVFIVSLLVAAAVADDRIALTNGAPPRNDTGASRGPIDFEVDLRLRK